MNAARAMDEAELIRRCRAGEEPADAELFHRYTTRAVRLAYATIGDPLLAGEAAQDAFIQAFRAWGNLRPGAPFGPCFYTVVSNRARRLTTQRFFLALAPPHCGAGPARSTGGAGVGLG